jgi:hypothetical protein
VFLCAGYFNAGGNEFILGIRLDVETRLSLSIGILFEVRAPARTKSSTYEPQRPTSLLATILKKREKSSFVLLMFKSFVWRFESVSPQ